MTKSRHYYVDCCNSSIVIMNRGMELDNLGFEPQLSLRSCMTWAYHLPKPYLFVK